MKPYAAEWFDTSVYVDKEKGEHPSVKICNFPVALNKKKAGLMADDSPFDFITEYWGTVSKEYCFKREFGKPILKAKGIGKKTRDNLITWEDFHEAIFGDGEGKEVEQRQIRSYDFKNHAIKFDKKIFTGDKKRILLDDKINTLSNGHWRDVGVCILPDTFLLPKKGTLGRKCLEVLRENYRKKLFG